MHALWVVELINLGIIIAIQLCFIQCQMAHGQILVTSS